MRIECLYCKSNVLYRYDRPECPQCGGPLPQYSQYPQNPKPLDIRAGAINRVMSYDDYLTQAMGQVSDFYNKGFYGLKRSGYSPT
jgi:hypothetical protein